MKDSPEQEIIRMGCCRYCGQQQDVSLRGFGTEAEANDYVSQHCGCEESQCAASLEEANAKIKDIFEDFGEEAQALLQAAAKCIYSGTIDKATIQLDGQTKATLQIKVKDDMDKIQIKKTVTENVTATV